MIRGIGGEIGAQVACRGEIVRSAVSGKDHAGSLFAASIVKYRFRRGGVRRVAGVGFQRAGRLAGVISDEGMDLRS